MILILNKEALTKYYLTEKKSIRQVAKEMSVAPSTILKNLKEYGIPIRDKSQSRKLYFEINETVDSEFFKSMSPELAYILGLWITDGCTYERGSFSIGLKDKDVIEWVANTIGYKNKTWVLEGERSANERYFIQFTNQEVKKVFDKYGIVPNKSLIIKMPDIPNEYIPHFIRGVFEGDGHVGDDRVSIVSASKEFIYSIKSVIEKEIGGDRKIYFDNRGNGLYLYNIYGKSSIKSFGDWVYPSGVFGMARKKNKFNKFKVI